MSIFETKKSKAAQFVGNSRGAVLILVALGLVAIVGFIALAVDIGHVMVTRNELQNTADAAALSGARALGKKYEALSLAEQAKYVCDPVADKIVDVVEYVAAQNEADRTSIEIVDEEIEVGKWNAVSKSFTPGNAQPDAVRIKARKDSLKNAPITTYFARIFGKESVDVSATATAALTALSTAALADLELPVGISKVWYEKGVFCGESIKFYPTDSCAGWTDFSTKKGKYAPDEDSVSDIDVRTLLADIRTGKFPYSGMPTDLIAGSSTEPFSGGTLSTPVFDEMEKLFDSKKTCDSAGENCYWETLVLVYDRPGDTIAKCGNPNARYTIVGFSTIRLEEVIGAAGKYLKGTVICGPVETGRGSGGDYGTKGSIPNLVQ